MIENYIVRNLSLIKNKKIKIGIVGLGYVGLPLAYAFCKKKIKVLGFDTDDKKIKVLKSKKSYISYFSNNKIKEMLNNGLELYRDFKKISEVDCLILCLPTPLTKKKSPDMSYIKNSMKSISKHLRSGQTLSLESTTYPGTCRSVILPFIEKRGFKVGKDFFLIYSPEREDPGNKKYSLFKIPKVVGGMTSECLRIGTKIYELLSVKVVKVSSIEIAEFTKLLENIYRSINIGLVNELKMFCTKMKIDIFEIINAAKTKPFGFQAFYPGPGYGGHCIPIDPFLLTWAAKKYNFETKFIKLSGETNSKIISLIHKKITKLCKKKNEKILILGVAYKKNVDDYRESPALVLMNKLSQKKIDFDYYDPYVKMINNSRSLKKISKLKSIKLNYKNISSYHLVVLITDHDLIDYSKLQKYSKLILDTRGVYKYGQFNNVISI